MTQLHPRFSRAVLTTLIVAPLGVMGILSVSVLLPAIKDPYSRFYSSGLGYPALQRLAGKPIKVQTVAVVKKSFEDSVAAPGESFALQSVNVRALVSGPVEKVYVVEGQRVSKGQPLLQLQKVTFADRVNTARNNVAIAEKTLSTLQSATPTKLQELKANISAANSRLDGAKTQLTEINTLAEQQQKTSVQTATEKLKIAETKLKQIRLLGHQGAISKFQQYDIEDIYTTRKQELIDAQRGVLATKTQQFTNKDFYITKENELNTAQKELDQVQKTTEKELAEARLNLENQRIALQNALIDLNRTVIYANNDGLVSRVNIHPGEIVNSTNGGDTLISLTQDIVFKAYIDQARLDSIKMGDHATVRLVSYPGRIFSGRVIRINPTVETNAPPPNQVSASRQYTYSVWVAVNEILLPPGLQGYVEFNRGNSSLVIPESAVTHLSGGEGMVMVAQDGKAVVKKVKLGRVVDNQRLVLEGLTPREQVVMTPITLKSGDRLEIATPTPK